MKLLKGEIDVNNKKEKLPGIILARAFCCLGIVIFHYFCHSNGNFKFLFLTANSTFGFIFVTTFFNISGLVLYYNYPKVKSIKKFYYKRWKSILLPYYICFFYFFLKTAFNNHKLFYKGKWPKIFINLVGLDGYLSYKFETYYLIGEWFLGAIIIIYILYPLLILIITNCNIIINNIIICLFYFLMYKKNFLNYGESRHIITCIMSFYFGIETIRFKKFYLTNKITFIISLLIFIFLSIFRVRIYCYILIFQIQGFSLFIILYQIGQYAMKKNMNTIFNEISNMSYSIYLFHHQIINDVLSIHNPREWYYHIFLLSIVFLLTFICSKIHLLVVKSVYKSFIIKKLDSFFI